MAERALVLGEAWPGVGLEAWFVGYLAGSAATVEAIRTYKQIISICTSTATQYAAVAAAEVYPALHRRQVEALAESYESGLDRARALGLPVVEGATASLLAVAVADVPSALAALAEAGISVADGAEFGAPGLLRLAATADDALVGAIERLAATMAARRGAGPMTTSLRIEDLSRLRGMSLTYALMAEARRYTERDRARAGRPGLRHAAAHRRGRPRRDDPRLRRAPARRGAAGAAPGHRRAGPPLQRHRGRSRSARSW